RADRGRRAIADTVAPGPAKPVMMLFHRPEPVRPVADVSFGRDQRPIEILDLCPGFHHQTRGADGRGIPGNRCGFLHVLAAVSISLAEGFTALIDGSLAVVGNGGPYGFNERRQCRLGVGRHRYVDDLETLEVLVVRLGDEFDRIDADQFGTGFDLGFIEPDAVIAIVDVAVHDAPEIRQLHADDDVGLPDHVRRAIEIVRFREVHPAALIDNRGLQAFSKLDEQLYAVRCPCGAVDNDDRVLGIGEQACRFLYRTAVALWRRAGHEARDIKLLAYVADRLLLQASVQRHHHRSVR